MSILLVWESILVTGMISIPTGTNVFNWLSTYLSSPPPLWGGDGGPLKPISVLRLCMITTTTTTTTTTTSSRNSSTIIKGFTQAESYLQGVEFPARLKGGTRVCPDPPPNHLKLGATQLFILTTGHTSLFPTQEE